MTYVALSRVKTLQGLHLMNLDPSRAKPSKACVSEIARLQSLYKPSASPIAESSGTLIWVADRNWCEHALRGSESNKATKRGAKATTAGPAAKKPRRGGVAKKRGAPTECPANKKN